MVFNIPCHNLSIIELIQKYCTYIRHTLVDICYTEIVKMSCIIFDPTLDFCRGCWPPTYKVMPPKTSRP